MIPSIGPIRAHNPNGISIGSAVFAQLTEECPYTLQWDVPPRLKLSGSPFSLGEPDFHLIHGCLGRLAHPSPQPKRHLDRFSRFCRAHYCDRQTDRRQTTLLGR